MYDARTDGAWAADEREGGRWVVVCDKRGEDGELHGGLIQETNRRRAQSLKGCPEEWCPACREEVDGYGSQPNG